MKNIIVIITISFCIVTNAQETEYEHILNAPDWGSEFFDFPISFAPDIPYNGYEEAVFPKGWSQQDSNAFWSYAFAWQIDTKTELPPLEIETQLERYFNGLMDIKNREDGKTILPTKVTLVQQEISGEVESFVGSVRLYEGRYTKKMMILYAKASIHRCKENNETIILFKFSPRLYDKTIWQELDRINIIRSSCE